MAKVNILIRADGEKKAYVQLTPENWDHLNWVQLANSKYKSFHYLKKKILPTLQKSIFIRIVRIHFGVSLNMGIGP